MPRHPQQPVHRPQHHQVVTLGVHRRQRLLHLPLQAVQALKLERQVQVDVAVRDQLPVAQGAGEILRCRSRRLMPALLRDPLERHPGGT